MMRKVSSPFFIAHNLLLFMAIVKVVVVVVLNVYITSFYFGH